MLITPIPWPWRALALGACLIGAGLVGWMDGASHARREWASEQAAQAQASARRATRAAAVQIKQTAVTTEVSRDVEARLRAVRDYYRRPAERVREHRAPGDTRPVPPAADTAGGVDGAPAAPAAAADSPGPDAELAGLCAAATVQLQGWQDWWGAIEHAQQ